MMTTRHLVLSTGHPRDIAAVDALMAAAFEPRFGEAWTHGQVLGVLAMRGVHLMLASVDDRPAGFALIRTVLDETELLLLAVDPALRRRGIGRSLLAAAMDHARNSGAHAMFLEVRAGNDATHLYARGGFTKVGERRGYYRAGIGPAHDAHSYRVDLCDR